MKKLRTILAATLLLVTFGGATALAAAPSFCDGSAAKDTDFCQQVTPPQTKNPVVTTITAGVNILSYLVGITSVIMILIGSIRYIISNGDQARIKSAKDTVMYSAIGVFVALLAQVLVVFVLNKV